MWTLEVRHPAASCNLRLQSLGCHAMLTFMMCASVLTQSSQPGPHGYMTSYGTLFRPWRTLSPSSRAVSEPRRASSCSTVHATVLLPLPLRPVNQTTQPRCPSIFSFCALRDIETQSHCTVRGRAQRSAGTMDLMRREDPIGRHVRRWHPTGMGQPARDRIVCRKS